MNQDAGCGNWLFVTLRLESGEELPFFLDTGAVTFLDKSLGTTTVSGQRIKHEGGRYAPPKLFLGSTRLMTGDHVSTCDLKRESAYAGRPVMGVLGVDCLKHYCIQLDFQARKVRFLDPNRLDRAALGTPLPLIFPERTSRPFLQNGSLVEGAGTRTLIDTGYDADGALNSEHFGREVREGRLLAIVAAATASEPGFARLPKCVWNGSTYTNLVFGNDWNVVGLRFLARHLVTLNFPKATMYLKQTSIGPLADQDLEAGMKFLLTLKEKAQLPGWLKEEHGELAHGRANADSVSISLRKKGDSSIYHYKVIHASIDGAWTLQRACRMDQNGNTIEEYR